jgi:hypothetical protein
VRLTDDQRLDWLRLIRSDNVGPRGIMAQTPPSSITSELYPLPGVYLATATQVGFVMPRYYFALINSRRIEDQSGELLADDTRAIAYGKQVIHDLTRGGGHLFSGWTMEITENQRVVTRIPLESCALSDKAG